MYDCKLKGSLKGSECIFIKVLLLILALLLVLLLLANITLTAGYGESFYYKLSIYGIPIKLEWFAKGQKKEKKKPEKRKKQVKKAKLQKNEQAQTEKEEKSVFTAALILKLLEAVAKNLPRAFRIKLCFFELTLGGQDAAAVAINYGRFYALLSAVLGLFENYRGLLCGFRAKPSNIILQTDFTKNKSEFSAKLKISCFLWQLLFAAVRIGIVFVIELMKSESVKRENAVDEALNS